MKKKCILMFLYNVPLLIFVWMNSHWSVALSITMLVGSETLFIFYMAIMNDCLRMLLEQRRHIHVNLSRGRVEITADEEQQ